MRFPALPTIHSPEFLFGMLLGDVNGDDVQDSLVIDSSYIHVALGQGDGTFTPAPSFRTRPRRLGLVRAADLTGDGKDDLVMSDVFDGFLTIEHSTGAIFEAAPTVPLGLIPFDMQLADVDGNARPDIIVLTTDGTLGVLLDNGPGFHPVVTYSAGAFQTPRLSVGDLSGDGRAEIVVTNLDASTVSVFPNLGSGTFGPRVAYPVPRPYSVGLARLDGDEDLDVVVTSRSAEDDQSVAVFLNSGDGTLAAPTYVPAGPRGSHHYRSLTTADLDGDTHTDVIVGWTTGVDPIGATALYGTGTGSFTGARTVAPDTAVAAVAVADVTGDDRADVLLQAMNEVLVFASTGTADRFSERTQHGFDRPGESASRTYAADLDGDGTLDVLGLFHQLPDHVAIRRMSDGTGQLAAPVVDPIPMSVEYSELADFNADGRTDVLVVGVQDDVDAGARVLLASPTGELQPGPFIAGPHAIADAVVGDVTEDGIPDLFLVEPDAGAASVRFYRGLGTGMFSPAVVVTTIGTAGQGGSSGGTLALIDLNDDEHLDLVLESYADLSDLTLTTFRGNGDGTFQAPTFTLVAAIGTISAHDVDGDGRRDLVEIAPTFVVVRKNLGTGSLGPRIVTAYDRLETLASFGDLDGDGHVDIVRGGYVTVSVQRGRGDGTFEAPVFYDAGAVSPLLPPTVGDVDADGRLDIVLGNNADRFSVLHGRCR